MKFPSNNCVIIHYGEIALKGGNRSFFEKKLKDNIKKALTGIDFESVERIRGRFILYFDDTNSVEAIKLKLQNVFGISYFSFGLAVARDIKVIKETSWQLLSNVSFDSLKIAARRAQKDFRLNSMEINRQVGEFIQKKSKKRVDLSNPDVSCFIEINEKVALIYTEKIPGLRGLPVGVSENAVSLLSSGIDSPVASYLMLKRGVNLIYAHFHSQPYTNQASQENAEELVKKLCRYQLRAKIYSIPFINIQKEIMAKAPEPLRVLLYRRYMVRLSERIATLVRASALVTGENVGQVASQTLSNIRVVSEVTSLPILRPVAGFDKEEIITLAQKIDTFEISIEPYEDCCTLFVPKNPSTKAQSKELLMAEKHLDVDELMDEAIEMAEVKILNAEPHRS